MRLNQDVHYTLARQKNGNHLQCKYRLEDLGRDKNAPQLGDFMRARRRTMDRRIGPDTRAILNVILTSANS